MKTTSDTADATLALKGILGIGAAAALQKSKTTHGSNSGQQGNHSKKTQQGGLSSPSMSPSTPLATSSGTPFSTNKKNSNNQQQQSKSNSRKKKKQLQENKDVKKQSTNIKKKKKDQQPQQQNQQQGKKGTKKKSPKVNKVAPNSSNNNNKPKPKQQSHQTKDENFAWSAFQSPPDPSALPLPAFGKSFDFEDSFNDKLILENNNDENNNDEDPVVETTSIDTDKNANASKNLRNGYTTPSKQNTETAEREIKAILNICNDSSNHSSKHNHHTEEKVVEQNESNSPSKGSGGVQREPSSNSHGINLASLTISADPAIISTTVPPPKQNSYSANNPANINNNNNNTPSHPTNTSNNAPLANSNNSSDPIAMLMNAQSYGTANPTIHSPHQSYNMYPNQHHISSHYAVHSPQQQQQMQHQMIPPYYTIQVQVPPVLMPGRRMIVPASPMTGGYPIPVVVPEGVVPGMFIPVSIPNPNARGNLLVHQQQH